MFNSCLDEAHCGNHGYWCANCWEKWYSEKSNRSDGEESARGTKASQSSMPFPQGTNPKTDELWTALASDPDDKGSGKRKRVNHVINALRAVAERDENDRKTAKLEHGAWERGRRAAAGDGEE